jgi:hypothetical protein
MAIFHQIKFNFICLVLTTIMACSGPVLIGQEVIVSARLDTTRALIGDQLRLHLRVDKTPQAIVAFPGFQDTLTGKIEIVRKSAIDTARGESGRVVLNQDLLVSVFDTGFYEIPSLAFVILNGQEKDTLKTLPVNFEIVSLKVDTTIRDIRANMKTPVNAAEILPFALGLIALGLIVFLLVYWIRRKLRKRKDIISEVLSEPADVIALRELEQLREEKPWVQKQVKQYYIRLTEILRLYIERRFRIMALEQTTDEILASLKKSLHSDSGLKRLASILKLADLVKFAKVIPNQEENEAQLDEAVSFVMSSAPTEDEPTQQDGFEHVPVQSNVES